MLKKEAARLVNLARSDYLAAYYVVKKAWLAS